MYYLDQGAEPCVSTKCVSTRKLGIIQTFLLFLNLLKIYGDESALTGKEQIEIGLNK
jgi:hypothetical protein